MKKFINSLKNSVKSTFSKDPYHKTDLDSIYFKKVITKDLPNEKTASRQNNYIVEENIKSLNRTILTGINKKLVQSRISQLIYDSKFQALKPEIKDLCEIIDYACNHNTPVRITYLKMLVPAIEIEEADILNEENYENWLKKKSEEEGLPQDVFQLEDEYGMREEGTSKRGKQSYPNWKTSKGENIWRNIKK